MKDIRISDHANWRHVHWNALLSAYGESPFFEYYQDDIRPFYEKKYEFLFDFNMETTEKMIELLDIRPKISITEAYIQSKELKEENEIKDFRDAIRPKKPLSDPEFESKRYYQVYEQKHGFQPNMSILDLYHRYHNLFFSTVTIHHLQKNISPKRQCQSVWQCFCSELQRYEIQS